MESTDESVLDRGDRPMPVRQELEFEESASFSRNMQLFMECLTQEDPTVADILHTNLDDIRDATADRDSLLDFLFDEIVNPERQAASGTIATQPSAASQVTEAWLLKGISVEGFRGINNEGAPLSLEFAPDRVNSVSAQNGVGKSSIFEAVLYAIKGNIEWLDQLPASEKPQEYYLNKFHSGAKGAVWLQLISDVDGREVVITVERLVDGTRITSATPGENADSILASLNREFVLLDARTFQSFIGSKPLDRGRAFAGLLGLSEYSKLRIGLQALGNTRAFNGHFEVSAHERARQRAQSAVQEAIQAIQTDYQSLVGDTLEMPISVDRAQAQCHGALAGIPVLAPLCAGRTFLEISADECVEAVKVAEGGPDKQRLSKCIRAHTELLDADVSARLLARADTLLALARARDMALAQTAGSDMLGLYKLGEKILGSEDWEDRTICPLCDQKAPHDVHESVTAKLDNYSALTDATDAVVTEWSAGGWSNLIPLEARLASQGEALSLGRYRATGEAGTLTVDDVEQLVERIKVLRHKAEGRLNELQKERSDLEKKLPASLVEVTRYIEFARRLQSSWVSLGRALVDLDAENKRKSGVDQLKRFLDGACELFARAESRMASARLAAVEPQCREYFRKLSFYGVVPGVSKREGSEELNLKLDEFFGLRDLSPQAILSESFRNAFAVSIYLAAASLYGGVPRFIILDDVTSSFDAGHQNFLVELIRASIARPVVQNGLQVIMFSHDTMLEKLFNRHSNSTGWRHQRLEGTPQTSVLQQSGAVNRVYAETIRMLQAGRTDDAAPRVRQYLEYKLNEVISALRIPVPIDIAFGDSKKLAGDYLRAIDDAVKLHKAASSLVLDPLEEASLNATMTSIVANYLSHWETGQTQAFSSHSLLGVMQAIDDYVDCFKFAPSAGAPRKFYKSLSSRT
jgi:hypothetical protein